MYNSSTIAQEEVFGPVLRVTPPEDEDPAIRIAKDSIYGLNSLVFAADVDRARSVARQLRALLFGHNAFRSDIGIAVNLDEPRLRMLQDQASTTRSAERLTSTVVDPRRLGLGKLVQRVGASLAADAALLNATVRYGVVPYSVGVDPNSPAL